MRGHCQHDAFRLADRTGLFKTNLGMEHTQFFE